MRRGRRSRILRLGVLALAAAALLLALAQLILPPIAADRIRSRVARYGSVRSVRVSAWPAIELLWGEADSVHVEAGALALSPAQATKLLWEARGAHTLDASATQVRLGGLEVTDVALGKEGARVFAGAVASAAAVRAALPPGVTVRLLRSTHEGVRVRVSGGLFAASAPLQALASAQAGSLVVTPLDRRIAGARLTLLDDRHVRIDGVGAQAIGAGPLAYQLTLRGRLR